LGMSMMMDSPSNPTPVSTLSMSGTLSSRLRDTQTSMMGRRASRRRDAGSRKAWEDARVPIRRMRRERAEMKCMSPWVEGRSLRAQRYNEGEGCVGEDGKSKSRVRGYLILSQLIIQGRIPKIPYLMHLMSGPRCGVGGSTHFPQHYAVPQGAAK
jgi:hypothetical protein